MLAEVSVVPFKFKHLQDLIDLHKTNDYKHIDILCMATLPKIGFIAYLNKQPIAAGFLRRLEPCYAQIDTLVSNSHFGGVIRNIGIKLVVDTLLDEAKRLKLHGIICHTEDEGVLKRAISLGFTCVDQKIIALSTK